MEKGTELAEKRNINDAAIQMICLEILLITKSEFCPPLSAYVFRVFIRTNENTANTAVLKVTVLKIWCTNDAWPFIASSHIPCSLGVRANNFGVVTLIAKLLIKTVTFL